MLRVQNKQFSEEKGYILRDAENEVYIVSAGIRNLDPLLDELSTAELSDSLMNEHKSSVYQVSNSLFTINQVYAIVTKCCVKIVATLTDVLINM